MTELALRGGQLVDISTAEFTVDGHGGSDTESTDYDAQTFSSDCGAESVVLALRPDAAVVAPPPKTINFPIRGKAKNTRVVVGATADAGKTVSVHIATFDDTRVVPAPNEKHPERFDHLELWWHSQTDLQTLNGVLLTQDSAGAWIEKRLSPASSTAALPNVSGTLDNAIVTFSEADLGILDQNFDATEWSNDLTVLYQDATSAKSGIKATVGTSKFNAKKPSCMGRLLHLANGARYPGTGS